MEEHEGFAGSYEDLTATSDTVAASILKMTTFISSNDDNDVDDISVADGVKGDIKIFVVELINAGDDVTITPASANNFTQITFDELEQGLGCVMVFDGTLWNIVANSGGTIA